MTDAHDHPCPLCRADVILEFARDRRREYWRCAVCGLVFVAPEFHPTAAQAKARYDLHRNGPGDAGYRAYLDRLFRPLAARLVPGSRGLDFGCGPGPTLSRMFEEAGHRMALYDPFYAPDAAVLEARYDFITATEVVEHLQQPAQTFKRLRDCLRPGGWLGIMTQWQPEPETFASWHYKDDFTHVVFYSRQTLLWLAHGWGAEVEFPGVDVALLRVP